MVELEGAGCDGDASCELRVGLGANCLLIAIP